MELTRPDGTPLRVLVVDDEVNIAELIAMALRYEVAPAPGRNVVAVLPGRDPALRGQYVALGAHTDHDPLMPMGVDHDSLRAFNAARERLLRETGARRATPEQLASIRVNVDSLRALRGARSDSIKNGADDDGSGTVVLLELAERRADRGRGGRSTGVDLELDQAGDLLLRGHDAFRSVRGPTPWAMTRLQCPAADAVGRGVRLRSWRPG